MQTLKIDNTTYKLKFDKCPIEWAKKARKKWKPAPFKDLRKFPTRSDLTTAEYVRQFEYLNNLQPVEYFPRLNVEGTALYDPTMPLLEEITE